MRRLNPFRGLDRPVEVWAWGMYDLANQSFTLLIITLLFPIYFKDVIVGDPSRGDSLWSLMGAGSLLIVVVLSPIVGAAADAGGWRKPMLVLTGLGCAAMTCSLWFLGPDAVLLAGVLFVGANVLYQIGENFLASFLPGLSNPRTIGRVSALGWTMGYAGALLLLVFTALAMKLFGLGATEDWRPLFVFTGVWFVLGMIPPALLLREPPRAKGPAEGGVIRHAHRSLMDTLSRAAHYRQLVRFLTAFLVYGCGVQATIYFASIIAKDFGFTQVKLVLFVLQLTVTAGIASALTARFQDRIGTKATVSIYLSIWAASAVGLGLLTLPADAPEWWFWVIGNGLGVGLGGIGTASRAMVGRFTPRHLTAQFFGLWGMTYKLAGLIGLLAFGQSRAFLGDTISFALLSVFFLAGLVLVLRVDERAGIRAARRTERSDGYPDPDRAGPTPAPRVLE